MLKKLKKEKIDKDSLILDYINEYIKLLPIVNTENDNILKQEPNIYINKSNEYVEEQFC